VPPLTQTPKITTVVAASGKLTFHIVAPVATEYGVAIWADPTLMGYSGSNIYPAGHAGAVAVFSLPAGTSDQTIQCAACNTTTFAYST
jgi:LSD1 subclass zinc finger protein